MADEFEEEDFGIDVPDDAADGLPDAEHPQDDALVALSGHHRDAGPEDDGLLSGLEFAGDDEYAAGQQQQRDEQQQDPQQHRQQHADDMDAGGRPPKRRCSDETNDANVHGEGGGGHRRVSRQPSEDADMQALAADDGGEDIVHQNGGAHTPQRGIDTAGAPNGADADAVMDGGGGGSGGVARTAAAVADPVQEARANNCVLYVCNLQWWTTDARVEVACAEHGPLAGLAFLEDRATGKSKGVAVVEFLEPEAAARCKEQLHGKSVDGRTVATTWVAPAGVARAAGRGLLPGSFHAAAAITAARSGGGRMSAPAPPFPPRGPFPPVGPPPPGAPPPPANNRGRVMGPGAHSGVPRGLAPMGPMPPGMLMPGLPPPFAMGQLAAMMGGVPGGATKYEQ